MIVSYIIALLAFSFSAYCVDRYVLTRERFYLIAGFLQFGVGLWQMLTGFAKHLLGG